MENSLHYLLMSDHLLFQKVLLDRVRDTGLTPGQPKILDYLSSHDGAIQKDIAEACHIEPATLTSVLLGMEQKGLIERRNLNGNRRSLYVFLTASGRTTAEELTRCFEEVERQALTGFSDEERARFMDLLSRVNENMCGKGDKGHAEH